MDGFDKKAERGSTSSTQSSVASPEAASTVERSQCSTASDVVSGSPRKSSKPTQKKLDPLVEETRQLLILDGLTRGEIKKRLKADHKTLSQEKIDKAIDNTFRVLTASGQPDGNGHRYFIDDDGQLCRAEDHGEDSLLRKLTNFSLSSIRPIVRDDGVEKHRSFEIEAKLGNHTVQEELSADDFSRMQWPMKVLGPAALVTPRTEPESRYGLQITAQHKPEKLIFTHTGWRIDGKPYYLHAGGAIGVNGNQQDVKATLPGNLRRFSLPDPPTGDGLKTALRASMGLLDVADDAISFPLFSAIYRAPLGDAAMTVYSSGSTGLRKTAVNLVAEQHYGKDFDEKSILHWDSTSNFLKEDLFIAKDSILLVDDFVPTGGNRDIRKAHTAADEVMRSVGNQAGRGRLSKDGKPQIPHEPRGLMLSTGETRPTGHSLAARTLHLSFTKNSVDNKRLAQCQVDAKAGLCAQAMAAYLRYVAQRYDLVRERLKTRTDELRDLLATEGRLLRSAKNLASLAVGFEVFLSFATDAGAITTSEAEELWKRLWCTFTKLAADQDDLQQNEDPAREVLHRLNSALVNESIYLSDLAPGETVAPPPNAIRVGWKQSVNKGEGEDVYCDWYCEPEALYTAIVRLFREQGSTLPWNKEILWQRLSEQGYTRVKGDRKHYFRKSINSKQHRLIYIPAESFRRMDAEAERQNDKDSDPNTPTRWSW